MRRNSKMITANQRGVVLLLGLAILLMLTLLGLSAASSSALESKMAANSQEMQRATLLADSTLFASLADVENLGLASDLDAALGRYSASSGRISFPDGAEGEYQISLRSEPVVLARGLQEVSGQGFGFLHFRIEARAETSNGLRSTHWRIIRQLAPMRGTGS